MRVTPQWTNGVLADNHRLLMKFQYFNNEQSRILQYLLPEALHRLAGVSIPGSYAFLRLIFVFAAFLAFHQFLRKWFSSAASFAGVLFLAASMPLIYRDDLQESAPLLMLLFVLGLWAIRENRDILYMGLLFLGGGLTNESMLVMPVGYFFYHYQWDWSRSGVKKGLKLGLRTVLLALPAFLAQGIIRYITRGRPQLGGAWHLPDNLNGIASSLHANFANLYKTNYLFPLWLFAIFWLYALLGYKKSPKFLQGAFWIVPLFLLGNMITGIITEARQLIPLGFIIIPMGLFFIFPEKPDSPQSKPGEETSVPVD
jgi:hypothetical protein